MRALVWPTYTYQGNVGADSLYLIARNLLREVTDGVWYLVVPEWAHVEDDLDDNPHVVKVPAPMSYYRTQEAIPNPAIVQCFAPQDGELPVELMISMSPARTLSVANHWSIRTSSITRPVLVNWDLLVRDDQSGEMKAEEVELMQMAAGCWAADANVFESPMARKMSMDVSRKMLAPAQVRKVSASSLDIPQGIPVSKLLSTIEGVEKRDRFAVYYGGRFSTSKRVEELSEVIDALYRFGRKVDFVVTTGSLNGPRHRQFMEAFPEAELHVGLSQEEAWKVMGSCHASLCFSTHELFGMAFWEQMATGLSVVMKAERWNQDLLPPGYPLVVHSTNEARVVLRNLYDQWKTWEPDPQWSKWVIDHYDSGDTLKKLVKMVKSHALVRQQDNNRKFDSGTQAGLVELVRDSIEDGMTWGELVDSIRSHSRIGKNVIGHKLEWAKSYGMLEAYRVAMYLGWLDVGKEVPVFSAPRSYTA